MMGSTMVIMIRFNDVLLKASFLLSLNLSKVCHSASGISCTISHQANRDVLLPTGLQRRIQWEMNVSPLLCETRAMSYAQ